MDVACTDIDLDRDAFVRDLLRELSGLLEEVVGLDEARGFVALVGQRIGRRIDALYRPHLGDGEWSVGQLASVLVDLKRRIQGGFSIEAIEATRITLVNDRCPFGDKVLGRSSLCMMTSNVFGNIAAEHRGFAQVALEETIAAGDGRCRVVIHLDPERPVDGARQYRRS
ncbi:methanogen output domain 1-containing protein [Pseudomarimonas salicorniae]|uniref:Methanogen output domain 1-containing protein n=1 Tax=Pseudomarimonas salicorniae TaxID=2933270 RepID=A0ABT0GLX5_9GAMM|nr:methanogen output domain 1-containing protein [Lysobacter sp. CAU 1642]MCK7595367.1 methanogen output domain 1-containing protein [Lysobacter sp. CAU 1642]